jgi:ankyrin repeat protein
VGGALAGPLPPAAAAPAAPPRPKLTAEAQGELDAALLRAVEANDLVTARDLLDSGASPNPTSGRALVVVAVQSADYSANSGVSQSDPLGLFGPKLGGLFGPPKVPDAVIRLLLDRGANINAQEPHTGQTALMVAASDGRDGAVKIARLLLSRRPDVNIADRAGKTALDYALEYRRPDIATLIQAARPKLTLRQAALVGDTDALRSLLVAAKQNGGSPVDLNAPGPDGRTLLVTALSSGSVAPVRALLEMGADPNRADARGRLPLVTAASFGLTEVVSLLLERGADINAQEPSTTEAEGARPRTALVAAAGRWYPDVVELLLKRGVDLKAGGGQGGQALVAGLAGRSYGRRVRYRDSPSASDRPDEPGRSAADVANLMLAAHADVNWGGATSLHIVIGQGDADTLRLLLDAGANPNLISGPTPQVRYTALGYAVVQAATIIGADKVRPCIELLLSRGGAKVDAPADPERSPALLLAVRGNSPELAALLLTHGANVNARDREGSTALMLAIDDGGNTLQAKAYAEAVAKGYGRIKTIPPGPDAKPPKTLPREQRVNQDGHPEMVRLLLSHKADVNARRPGDGMTALKLAIAGEFPEVVTLLKQAGAVE